MKCYRIADLVVEMDPQFAPLKPQALPYLYSGTEQPVASLCLTEEILNEKRKRYPEAEDPLLEYMTTGGMFSTLLLYCHGFMLHSSAIEKDGKAYLFSARSGTGKSTHTALWQKVFPHECRIINDDKPAIRRVNGSFYVYGTPWSGKTDLNCNVRVPLGGIAFLERAETNSVERILPKDAITKMLDATVRPSRAELFDSLLERISEVVKEVPLWRLRCNMDEEAARIAYQTMSKG